ncbi:hypothetical protein D3C73_961370 [compost metagenome]
MVWTSKPVPLLMRVTPLALQLWVALSATAFTQVVPPSAETWMISPLFKVPV